MIVYMRYRARQLAQMPTPEFSDLDLSESYSSDTDFSVSYTFDSVNPKIDIDDGIEQFFNALDPSDDRIKKIPHVTSY